MTALPVRPAHLLDTLAPEQRWLIEGLWAAQAVGILGGEPKCCLCRARHKQHHAASRIMPRASVSPPPDAATTIPGRDPTRHNQASSSHGDHAEKEETTCWRSSSPPAMPRRD
jgi:hypothetical protein